MPADHMPAGCAKGAGRLHVGKLAHHQGLAARQADVKRNADNRNRQHGVKQAWPERGGQRHGQHQGRYREHNVHHPHDDGVAAPAQHAGQTAQQRTDAARNYHHRQPGGNGLLAARQHAAEQIAAHLVGTKPVLRGRRLQARGQIQRVRVVRHDPRRGHHNEKHHQHNDAANDRERTLAQHPEQFCPVDALSGGFHRDGRFLR